MPDQMREGSRLRTRLKYAIITGLVILLACLFVPIPDYKPEYSKALYSKDGELLSAVTSSEEQWCFPLSDDRLPEKFEHCLLLYEDEYFYWHPGINLISVLKAAGQNLKAGRIVRGGSTIHMQVMRMRNRHAERNYKHKLIESISAIKFNLLHSRQYILKEWAEMAPFGGNTIGLRAASLRYYGREPDALSWSAYALLAVLPNAPGKINIAQNRAELKRRRNQLLIKLKDRGHISASDLEVYMDEDLPNELFDIPQSAYHLLQYATSIHQDRPVIESTVSGPIQHQLNKLLAEEATFMQIENIGNVAAVVINIQDNSLVAYTGNIRGSDGRFDYVDAGRSLRSYGSLLKPFLYAEALESGTYLPDELIPDIPTAIGDFRPKNFDKKFRGAVPMGDMVTQSLNVPAVRILNRIGLQNFYLRLQQLQVEGITRGVDHYGLSLILGGGESTLWDMCRLYKGLAQSYLGQSDPFRPFRFMANDIIQKGPNFNYRPFVIQRTIDVMKDVVRPREERSWSLLSSAKAIAWKTGTSYGHRDAWAIGFDDQYLVGVWVGNSNGEGRFGLTGIAKAAPIMFRVLNSIKTSNRKHENPRVVMNQRLNVCIVSGKLAGQLCKDQHSIQMDELSHKYETCQYHTEVLLDQNGYQIGSQCSDLLDSRDTVFTLPPVMSYYYRRAMPSYSGLPPASKVCPPARRNIEPIYPENGLKIFLPRDAADRKNQLIAQAYHIDASSVLYWYFNDKHICKTRGGHIHECIVDLSPGQYDLLLIDQKGNRSTVKFEVL